MLSLIANIRTSRLYNSMPQKGFKKSLENFRTDELVPNTNEVNNFICSKNWIETYRQQ